MGVWWVHRKWSLKRTPKASSAEGCRHKVTTYCKILSSFLEREYDNPFQEITDRKKNKTSASFPLKELLST